MKVSAIVASLLASVALAQRTRTVTSTVTSTVTTPRKCPRTVTSTTTSTASFTTTRETTATITNSATITSTAVSTLTITNTQTETQTRTETDTVTTATTETVTTATTTTVTATPPATLTGFTGSGYLYVYPTGGARKGCLISGGNWYAGGGSCATYRVNTLSDDNSEFQLSSSRGNCSILADNSFNCSASNDQPTTFGQTDDGNLTYLSAEPFFAKAVATGTTQQPVYATSNPVVIDIQWFQL